MPAQSRGGCPVCACRPWLHPSRGRPPSASGRLIPRSERSVPRGQRLPSRNGRFVPRSGRFVPGSHESTGVTPTAIGVMQSGMGVMREATVVMYATTFVTPAGSEGSCNTRPATQIPAVVIAERWGALHGLPAVSSGSRRGVRADLAVGRGPLALSAVRLVADRFADAAAREPLGKTRQGGAELLLQPLLVLFVLIACHGVHNCNTTGEGNGGGKPFAGNPPPGPLP